MATTTKGAQPTSEAPAAGAAAAAAATGTGTAADAQAGAAAGKAGDEGKGGDAGAGGDGKGGKAGEEQSGKGGNAADQGQGGDAGDGKPKAPASYTLAVPDDAKRFVSDDDLAFIQETARANDWTNEEAQAELDAHLDRFLKNRTKTVEGWETEMKADKVYGGKNLAETQRLGNLAVDKVLPKGHPLRDPFVTFLKESGGGVRREVVGFLAELGRLMDEDKGAAGTGAPSGGGDKASKFYDHPSSRKVEEQAAKGS